MLNVYCIPGMGVDERLYKNLKLDNCNIIHIKWLPANKKESLPHYAMRLAESIDTSKPFALIGVSFGGMCSVEISKKLHPVKTFVISSAKTGNEIPFKIKMWKHFPLHRLLNDTIFKKSSMIIKKQFGVFSEEQKKRFQEMMDSSPENYFVGAVNCVVTWDNKEVSKNVIHIHGTKDRVLPYKKIKCDYLIEDGTHFMIINRAEEINKIIIKELEDYSLK